MKRPQKFSTVVIVSLTAILLMMLPVSITGYAVYGSDVENNILDQLDNHSLMTQTANVLITLHLLFAFAIVQNPLHQGAEAALGLDPLNQKKKCIAVRLTIMVIGICLLKIFLSRRLSDLHCTFDSWFRSYFGSRRIYYCNFEHFYFPVAFLHKVSVSLILATYDSS